MHPRQTPPTPSTALVATAPQRPAWLRALWIAGGAIALLAGIVGLALPVVPTVPFVLLAAFCFSRGCERCERWMLEHRHFGPHIRNWRTNRSVPLRAKQLATVMMAGGSTIAWWMLPFPWQWLPGGCCVLAAAYLWWLPTTATGLMVGPEDPPPHG